VQRRPYLALNDRPGDRAGALALAAEIGDRGFAGIASSSRGDNLAWLLAVLDRTSGITVLTDIANIYLRHPLTMGNAASLIEELHPGRFLLGLGVSHAPMLAGMGVRGGRPLADMREYVQRMREAAGAAPFPPVILATLRSRMVALAGEIAQGAIWANAVRSRLGASLDAVPPGTRASFVVGNIAITCISDDRAEAVSAARRALRTYFRLPNYLNYFVEAGYEAEVAAARRANEQGDERALDAAVTERFIAETCLIGPAAAVREQAGQWYDAGVTHLVLSPIAPRPGADPLRTVLDALGS
jgi:alkanesulfonate monooxygenase SsuD/methylene tetrahydromethanopterin reductase-like flavin-dependent oxidoreductase (luciferase family)